MIFGPDGILAPTNDAGKIANGYSSLGLILSESIMSLFI
jgi:hypothetical protein